MKCTNRVIATSLFFLVCAPLLTGCSQQEVASTYDLYNSSYEYGILSESTIDTVDFFAADLIIADRNDVKGEGYVDSQCAEGIGLFNLDTGKVLYAQNIHKRLYPASTTKIMTAYVALKYGDLDQQITVSKAAASLDKKDNSLAEINEGDVLTLRQLLYGLLLPSGNDAAIAIAEGLFGSVEAFAEVMNEEALALGASNTHFVNSNGLDDPDHYTTVYDMYLMFNAAVKNDTLVEFISTDKYTAYYTDQNGNQVENVWENTNRFINGREDKPSGVTVIGGKTGTTGEAGYCLVMLSRNENLEPVISIVYKADGRSNLYLVSRQILDNYGNLDP